MTLPYRDRGGGACPGVAVDGGGVCPGLFCCELLFPVLFGFWFDGAAGFVDWPGIVEFGFTELGDEGEFWSGGIVLRVTVCPDGDCG